MSLSSRSIQLGRYSMAQGFSSLELIQLCDSERLHRLPGGNWIYFTDGIKVFVNQCRAFWILDEVETAFTSFPSVKCEPFQIWTATVTSDKVIVVTVTSRQKAPLFRKTLSCRQFPFLNFEFWVSRRVISLPGEYC